MATMQTIEATMTRPNGEPVRLKAKADEAGVMAGPWQAFDDRGQPVEILGSERWWAVAALHRAIEVRRASSCA